MTHLTPSTIEDFMDVYVSVAAGRDFWVTNNEKVEHVGTSGDLFVMLIFFSSTHPVKKWALHG